jgi:hypothetical protein
MLAVDMLSCVICRNNLTIKTIKQILSKIGTKEKKVSIQNAKYVNKQINTVQSKFCVGGICEFYKTFYSFVLQFT